MMKCHNLVVFCLINFFKSSCFNCVFLTKSKTKLSSKKGTHFLSVLCLVKQSRKKIVKLLVCVWGISLFFLHPLQFLIEHFCSCNDFIVWNKYAGKAHFTFKTDFVICKCIQTTHSVHAALLQIVTYAGVILT